MKRFAMKKIGIAMICVFALAAFAETAMAKDVDEDPYLKPDETWISIGGTAVDALPESFTLDYGNGTITVEMDEWKWYENNEETIEGDRVTVYGEVDDNIFATDTIEASSVYVESLGTYFYANAEDEEGDGQYPDRDYWVSSLIEPGNITVRGTVEKVEGAEFIIDKEKQEIKVDTAEMPYNPLDDKGFQKVKKGDYVSVTGEMDTDFIDNRELMAESVITLDND